jgi:hypothetical protein
MALVLLLLVDLVEGLLEGWEEGLGEVVWHISS